MELETRDLGDATIVAVREERIDAASAVQFKDAMRAATAAAQPRVVLDLAQVRFLDSSGLGAVIGAMKLLAPERRLELAALSPAVAKVFRLTRMDSIFTIHPEAESGAASLPGTEGDAA